MSGISVGEVSAELIAHLLSLTLSLFLLVLLLLFAAVLLVVVFRLQLYLYSPVTILFRLVSSWFLVFVLLRLVWVSCFFSVSDRVGFLLFSVCRLVSLCLCAW